jgi:hypothetical protein
MRRCANLLAAVFLSLALASAARAEELVYEKALPSTVWIVNVEKGVSGSGALVDLPRKLIVTNYHVVLDSPEVKVFFPNLDPMGEVITSRDS